jgi:hypothetical protein
MVKLEIKHIMVSFGISKSKIFFEHFLEELVGHIPDQRRFAWQFCSSDLAARPVPS